MRIGYAASRAQGNHPDTRIGVFRAFHQRRVGGIAPVFGKQHPADERRVGGRQRTALCGRGRRECEEESSQWQSHAPNNTIGWPTSHERTSMRRPYGSALAVAAIALVPYVITAQVMETSRSVAGGGINVPGWMGKIDASEEKNGQV